MAPNPSAALRVGLAALLAAGPFQPVFAAEQTVAGRDYIVLQVGDVVKTYRGIMIKAADLAGLKKDQEKEVDAIVPSAMERQGTFTGHTYKLVGAVEKVKVRVVEEPRTMGRGRYQLSRAGAWVAGRDNKPATFEGCVPNGDRRCFDGIAGVARNFILVTTAASPAPEQPRPAPVPTQPAPGANFAGPYEWRGAPINDTPNGVEHRKCKKAECSCTGDSCKGKRIDLYAVTKAEKAADTLKLKLELDPAYYLTHAGGKWNLCWVSGERASVPVAALTGFADAKFLPDATYWVKGASAAGDFKGAKKAEFAWSGTAPAKPKGFSAECAYGEPSGDALDAKLDELFGSNKVERAGADWVAETYGGKTGPEARKALLEALKGPKADETQKEVRNAVRREAAKNVAAGKPESTPFVGKRGVTKEDISKYICDLLPEGDGSAAAPSGGATSARAQLGVAADNSRAAAASTSDAGARGGAQIDERTPAGSQGPGADLGFEVTPELKTQCAIVRSRPRPQQPGPIAGPGTGPGPSPGADVPTPHGQQVTPDKAPADNSAEEAKKKKDLQRMAIGGAGGALVLGVFGFIFGGPIGAIAMGAIGFGLMAGVTYLNNNPIDK